MADSEAKRSVIIWIFNGNRLRWWKSFIFVLETVYRKFSKSYHNGLIKKNDMLYKTQCVLNESCFLPVGFLPDFNMPVFIISVSEGNIISPIFPKRVFFGGRGGVWTLISPRIRDPRNPDSDYGIIILQKLQLLLTNVWTSLLWHVQHL